MPSLLPGLPAEFAAARHSSAGSSGSGNGSGSSSSDAARGSTAASTTESSKWRQAMAQQRAVRPPVGAFLLAAIAHPGLRNQAARRADGDDGCEHCCAAGCTGSASSGGADGTCSEPAGSAGFASGSAAAAAATHSADSEKHVSSVGCADADGAHSLVQPLPPWAASPAAVREAGLFQLLRDALGALAGLAGSVSLRDQMLAHVRKGVQLGLLLHQRGDQTFANKDGDCGAVATRPGGAPSGCRSCLPSVQRATAAFLQVLHAAYSRWCSSAVAAARASRIAEPPVRASTTGSAAASRAAAAAAVAPAASATGRTPAPQAGSAAAQATQLLGALRSLCECKGEGEGEAREPDAHACEDHACDDYAAAAGGACAVAHADADANAHHGGDGGSGSGSGGDGGLVCKSHAGGGPSCCQHTHSADSDSQLDGAAGKGVVPTAASGGRASASIHASALKAAWGSGNGGAWLTGSRSAGPSRSASESAAGSGLGDAGCDADTFSGSGCGESGSSSGAASTVTCGGCGELDAEAGAEAESSISRSGSGISHSVSLVVAGDHSLL